MEYKTKNNTCTNKTNKNKIIDTDNKMVISRGEKGFGKGDVSKGGQEYSNRGKLNFGW